MWDTNTETDLAGYKLYQGTVSGGPYVYIATIPAGTETKKICFNDYITHYWVLTAYDTENLESGYSNEVSG